MEETFEEFQKRMDEERTPFDCNESDFVGMCLGYFILHLEGHSTRAIADMSTKLPSYTKISKHINSGRHFFYTLFPLMDMAMSYFKNDRTLFQKEFPKEHEKLIDTPEKVEEGLKSGKLHLDLSKKELKNLIELAKEDKAFGDAYPVLVKTAKEKLKEGKTRK